MARISYALVGIAGVHYVASELSRRGLIALPTTRNTAAYDIAVTTVNGKGHANVQVKTSLKRVTFFPMPSSVRVRSGPNDYYVLLRWLASEERFEGFLLSGRQARLAVQREERSQKKRIAQGKRRKIFPSIQVGPKAGARANRWRQQWRQWKL